jgi:PAS domain S-box-containing protein
MPPKFADEAHGGPERGNAGDQCSLNRIIKDRGAMLLLLCLLGAKRRPPTNFQNRKADHALVNTPETASNAKQSTLWTYLIAALLVAGAVWLRFAFNPTLGKRLPFLLFPIVVLVAARFGGWLPGLLATVLSVLGAWFFLTDPVFSFYIADKAEAESLALYGISATAISLLGGQVHATLLSRTRSEQAARQSETLVRALLDSAAQSILAVNSDGEIVMVNEMAEGTFGYKREELMHQPLDLLIPEGVNSRHRLHLKRYFANPSKRPMGIDLDIKARHKSGIVFPVEIALSHVSTAVGTLAIAFVTDISQRKHVEEERQKFVSLADRSLEFIGMCDLDFKPFYVNSAGLRLVGLDNLEAACRVMVPDYFFPEDQPFITNEFFPRVLRDGHGEVEIRFRHFKTGGPIWMLYNVFSIFDASGTHVGWATVSIDVNERREAQERLRKSEERFRATFFQAALGIAQTSIDGQWLLVNHRLCEILGYSRDELSAKTFIDITHPDDREASIAMRRRLLAGEVSSCSAEKRYIRKDGATVWTRLFQSLVRDQGQEPQYFISAVEDITEKLQAQRDLQQSRGELRAFAGRLINAQEEERKRISRELHDDLSQKLALLALNTGGLLAEPAVSSEKMNQKLRNLQGQVQQLAQDVRQISHRLHPSILDDLGLVAALNELCEEFSAREGIDVAFESESVPHALPIDLASCLYRVSQEALHNVLKHAQASQARLKLSASTDGIHLCIRDNGVGFDSEAGLSRPGLGIVSMKERINLVHGEFSIGSRPGQGTELRVFVPLARKAA